jgi:hypothetical protein
MMVVVGLISLMATLALPSIVALYNSGADAQAYNLIAAQLTAARAKAIVSSTYAGIHVQMADLRYEDVYGTTRPEEPLFRPELKEVSYSCLIVYDDPNKSFVRMPNAKPERVPGTIGVGYASEAVTPPENAVISGTLDATISTDPDKPFGTGAVNVEKFTTFSIIFNPLGAVTRFADGEPIHLDPNSPLFLPQADDKVNHQTTRLWRLKEVDYVQDRYGATAITIFDMAQYQAKETADKKLDFLNENARILPLNVHTGLLYERK